jgi:hypothetical protein
MNQTTTEPYKQESKVAEIKTYKAGGEGAATVSQKHVVGYTWETIDWFSINQ